MKIYKNVLLVLYIAMEMLALVLFLKGQISGSSFFLIAMSMSLMIGLYFLDRNTSKRK